MEAAAGFSPADKIRPVSLLHLQVLCQLSNAKVAYLGSPILPCTSHILDFVSRSQCVKTIKHFARTNSAPGLGTGDTVHSIAFLCHLLMKGKAAQLAHGHPTTEPGARGESLRAQHHS